MDHEDYFDDEDFAEPMECYLIQGLYYPISIGQVLVQRYRIDHKLGYGGFSTVWMAHDIHKNRDMALKILIYGDAGDYELSMQNEIIRTDSAGHLQTSHV